MGVECVVSRLDPLIFLAYTRGMAGIGDLNRASIDQLIHAVTSKDEHPNGVKDWWRVHMACGLSVDLKDDDFKDTLRWRHNDAVTCVGCMMNT